MRKAMCIVPVVIGICNAVAAMLVTRAYGPAALGAMLSAGFGYLFCSALRDRETHPLQDGRVTLATAQVKFALLAAVLGMGTVAGLLAPWILDPL